MLNQKYFFREKNACYKVEIFLICTRFCSRNKSAIFTIVGENHRGVPVRYRFWTLNSRQQKSIRYENIYLVVNLFKKRSNKYGNTSANGLLFMQFYSDGV